MQTKNKIFAFLKEHEILVKYCIIGVIGVTVDFVIFYILTKKLDVYYQLANVIGVSCGITNNFFLNSFYNFKVNDHLFNRFIKFYSIGLLGLFVTALVLFILVEQFNIGIITSKVATIFIVTIIQFNLNRIFSFGKRNDMKRR